MNDENPEKIVLARAAQLKRAKCGVSQGSAGRYSDRVARAQRRARVSTMLAQGRTLDSIAGILGVSRETIRRDARRLMQSLEKKSLLRRQEEYMLALERSDSLQLAVWFRALRGEGEALEIVLAIHDRRMKLVGLERLGTVLDMKKAMFEFLLDVAQNALDSSSFAALLDALLAASVPTRVLRGESRERDVLAPGTPN